MERPICCHCGCAKRFGTKVSIDRLLQRKDMDCIFHGTVSEDLSHFREARQKRGGGNLL